MRRPKDVLEVYQIELNAQNAELIRTQAELETQQIELEIQNEDLHRIQLELFAEKKYAEDIVETVREPLVVLNSDFMILTANNNFYNTFKVEPKETIGNLIYDIGNRQWDIPSLRKLLEDILPNNSVFNGYEVEHDFISIGRKVILLNARQIIRENVGTHIILLAMEDITERKLVEAERARLYEELQRKSSELELAKVLAEKANLAKSEFLSSMSHELRTPLGAILGFAQLIESGVQPPTPNQKRNVDQILKAGWYLLELINEILDLAHIESGKLAMSLEPVSMGEVIQECEIMAEPQAQKRGITIIVTPLEASYVVKADRVRVKQLLINLFSNAIKYNKEGGTVTVDCRLSHPNSIRISVRDTGEGLTQENIAQLFQPFNRIGRTCAEEGTGIGLVVCKRLVELMGGQIGVESKVGEGSVFWIELNQTTVLQSLAHPEESTTDSQVQDQGNDSLYTLLYIEDNPANLMLVEEIVSRRPDINFLSAVNAMCGIEIAQITRPDVILMDINLPGISGLDAHKILAENPATEHIPVIALSANAMPSDIKKCLDAGFFRYITKPLKINKFIETLDVALNLQKKTSVRSSADHGYSQDRD
jgi:signal transduction histidine kinase/CheY-like chemotaxis protein